jgi:3-oxoacyl-[acyl-carrier protein] reductase
VVSGGGTGIGRATASRFAADGDRVVLLGRRPQVLADTAARLCAEWPHAAVEAITADLSRPADVRAVRDRVQAAYSRVDVVVAAAGANVIYQRRSGPDCPIEAAADHWTGNFQANVLTAVLLCEGLRPLLADNGRVVLVSSIAAYRGSGSGSYGGSKAALHPYVYDLAAALGGRGIAVNAVAPGYVADTEFFGGPLPAERTATLAGQALNARAGEPADVAALIHWLASPEAGHITAQIVQINGGAERGR